MKFTTSFTVDATQKLCDITRRRGDDNDYLATILAYVSGTKVGTAWSAGGTLAYYLSPDNGTSLVPLKDLTGTAISSTGNDSVNTELGNASNLGDHMSLWAILAGSTSPTLTVAVYDNR